MPTSDNRSAKASESLAEAFARGDAAAAEQAVSDYYPRIASTVHRLAGWPRRLDVAGVDDLVQEVFVRALERRRQFRGDCEFGTWLTRIAVNVCRGHYRKSQVRRMLFGAFADERQRSTQHDQPADDAMHEATRHAVAQLPPKYREVIVLHYLEEYSTEEVAQTLALTRSAVQKRLLRARDKLEQLLAEWRPRNP